MNRYPTWVNWLVLAILVFGTIVALPNLFGDDPAVQISGSDGQAIEELVVGQVRSALNENNIEFIGAGLDDAAALIRFGNVSAQLQAKTLLDATEAFSDNTIALTLAPRTPPWLSWLGLEPMSLGLDLRGGVHFLYQVDLESAIQQFLESYRDDLRTELRDEEIRNSVDVDEDTLVVSVFDQNDMDRVDELIQDLDDGAVLGAAPRLIINRTQVDGRPGFRVQLTEVLLRERQDFAIQQNTITLRNRVNEFGVSEPVVQRQGLDRILVQLPGVQDPSVIERNLAATATLEYRAVDMENDPNEAARIGRAPLNSELYNDDETGLPVLLRREVIATGDQVTDATPGYDQNGLPAVTVNLNQAGGRRMLDFTQQNVGRNMAVVFIEEKVDVTEVNGETIVETRREERIISNAVINGVFSNRFQTTGLSVFEAQDLALLLRAGALATPIAKIEERTIGPSLGADNIARGRLAIIVGLALVMLYMAAYYRFFGLVANLALAANIVLIIAALSLFQAALTLPGIAGIVLTVGMAVDANVLIFERIREELRNGNSPQASIRAGYDKAFSTIADANITTFIAALVLFAYGTGPIKGFAVTLSVGILTSMFTAIVGTRVVVNLFYGSRKTLTTLSIGGRESRESHATV